MEGGSKTYQIEGIERLCECRFNEPLGRHTAFGVGGYARVFAKVEDFLQMQKVVAFCKERGVPFLVMGGGNKLLFKEDYPGVILKLEGRFRKIKVFDFRLIAGAGAKIKDVVNMAYKHSLSGMEFAVDIPGTVGGGVKMNAGAFGRSFADAVEWLILFVDGAIRRISKESIPFSYRECGIKEGIITHACFLLKKEEKAKIKERQKEYRRRRRTFQPFGVRTAGCVFKNPEGVKVGELVKALGLCGHRVGKAYISRKHGNFIITEEGACTQDVLSLIERIKEDVLRKHGLRLEEEIRIV